MNRELKAYFKHILENDIILEGQLIELIDEVMATNAVDANLHIAWKSIKESNDSLRIVKGLKRYGLNQLS